MATKVKLRQKPISGNRQSLYLDFYPAILNPETNELTRREFLNLYLYNENEILEQKYLDANGKEHKKLIPVLDSKGEAKRAKLSPVDKLHNKDTLRLAEQIRQLKDNQINKPEIYTGYEKEQLKIKDRADQNFVDYFKKLTNKRKDSNHSNWISAFYYLENFTNGILKFADLNETFCSEFRDHLLTTKSNKSDKVSLSHNSALSYFNKFKAALKQAYKDGYLPTDLNGKVPQIKHAETQRNFLTIEELNKLVKADCPNPLIKKAALFSALTGLRFSDIEKLVWDEIEYIKGNGYFIQFTQQKTKGIEMMPISEQAYNLLEKAKAVTDKVFEGLTYSAFTNRQLYQWIAKAGITKTITFHCFQHTFATLRLSKGTDIYTVSKMLGHRELKTTQIYAKIIDQTKREAANKIVLDL